MTRIAPLLLLALAAAPAAGQDRPRPEPPHIRPGGSEYFRFNLYLHKIQPLGRPEDALTQPAESMIVIMGDTTGLSDALTGFSLSNYLNAGGAILVLTNGPTPGRFPNSWAAAFGVRISGNPVTADQWHCYNGDPARPFVQPRMRVDFGRPSPFDLFNGVTPTGPRAVVTDRPSEMVVRGNNLYLVRVLAEYPAAARLLDGRPIRPEQNQFAVGIEPQAAVAPGGRMIVLANRGVFTNGLFQEGFVKDPDAEKQFRFDNGNWAFCDRTIKYLQGGGRDPRTKCLFVEDGRVVDRFANELPNTNPPVPDIPPDVIANWLLNAANPMIDEAQNKDVFNRVLESLLGLPRLVRMFLVTLTVVFIVAGLRWLTRAGRKAEPTAVLTPYTQATLLPRGGVLRQRTASQIEVGNLYEAARRRVRERFDVLGGGPGAAGQMPPVLTANDLPDGPVLDHSVRWLWTLGYGETPITIPPADWDRTNVLLERVTARAARGDWSFGQDA